MMAEKVKLIFECVVECDPQYADELGVDIATDILNEWDNGVDYLDWRFIESRRVIENGEDD